MMGGFHGVGGGYPEPEGEKREDELGEGLSEWELSENSGVSEQELSRLKNTTAQRGCQVPEKLNIRIRTNKELLAGHDLWQIDQGTAAVTPHEAGTDYKNCSSALLPAETLQVCDKTCVRLRRV